MADKEKIRAEIERLKKRAEHNFDISLIENERQFWLGESNVLTLIGKHIDTLQEEPTIPDIVDEHWWEMLDEEPVSEDLNSFAIKYAQDKPYPVTVCQAVKVGANWQKQNDEKALNENALLYNARLEGIEIGKAEMKQQMMKNAKEGVITFDYYGDNDKIYGCIAHDSFSLEELGLKDGDKVKLIIIKED